MLYWAKSGNPSYCLQKLFRIWEDDLVGKVGLAKKS
jgi:hypothetical protein